MCVSLIRLRRWAFEDLEDLTMDAGRARTALRTVPRFYLSFCDAIRTRNSVKINGFPDGTKTCALDGGSRWLNTSNIEAHVIPTDAAGTSLTLLLSLFS
jgi:hypothetical protein